MSLLMELRYAVRGLRRGPVFAFVAIFSIALGIGANSAIFSLVDGMWLRPPGIPGVDRLIWIYSATAENTKGLFSYPEYLDIERGMPSLGAVVARGSRGLQLDADSGKPELLLVNVVSRNFFEALAIRPALGTIFGVVEPSGFGGNAPVILGYNYWVRRFGASPSVIGKVLRLARGGRLISATVVGVLPKTFREIEPAMDRDLWMTPETWMAIGNRLEFENREARWMQVLGIMRPGVTFARASADLATVGSRMDQLSNSPLGVRRRIDAESDLQRRFNAGGAQGLALLAIVVLVLGITCANVANLLLARAGAREREIGIRLSIGMSRLQLARQLLVDAVVLGLAGAAGGLVLAAFIIRIFPTVLIPPPGFKSFLVFAVDARVLGLAAVATAITIAVTGFAPVMAAVRVDVASILKGEGQGAQSRAFRMPLRQALVSSQIALSLMLVSTSTLLVSSFLAIRKADLGFAQKQIWVAWFPFGNADEAFTRRVSAELLPVPAVKDVAFALRAPLSLSGGGYSRPVFVPERTRDATPDVKANAVSSNYFHAMGIRILQGRAFDGSDDRPVAQPVIIVNSRFASQYFAGGNCVGKTVRIGGPAGPRHVIVGVAENTAINTVGELPEPYYYLPFSQQRAGEVTVIVETAPIGPGPRQLHEAFARIGGGQEPQLLVNMEDLVSYSTRDYRTTAILVASLGILGIILTSVGVYGVVAYGVSQRIREIGIRSALGATAANTLVLILKEGGRLAFLGVTVGLPASLAAARGLRSLLFGTEPWNAAGFAFALAVVAGCVLGASLIPALRASRVDPAIALREP